MYLSLFCDWVAAQIYTNVLIKGLYGFTINGCVLIPFIIMVINVFFFQKLLSQILP